MKAFSKARIGIVAASISCVILISIVFLTDDRFQSNSGESDSINSGMENQRNSSKSARIGSVERANSKTGEGNSRNLEAIRSVDYTELAAEQYREVLGSDLRAAFKEIELAKIAKDYVGKVGIQYALKNVGSFAGPGANQNLFLRLLFQESIDSQELLLESARSISDPNAAHAAFDGALRNMRVNGVNPQALEKLFPLKEGEQDAFDEFAGGLINYKSADNRDISNVTSLIRKAYPGNDYDKHLRKFLLDVYEGRPNDVLLYCRSLDHSPDIQKDIAGRCLLLMVTRNASVGMDQAITIYKENPDIIPTGSIRSLMGKFLDSDYDAGQAWIQANASKLDQASKDSINSSLVDYSLKKKDLAAAQDWLNRIVNTDDKSAADSRIWTQERENLRVEVRSDPSGTVQSIISGQSKYADYWLEEAMGTWVGKDFNGAQDWYQNNWKTLPASKSQYVAAAFANQATQQGDMATARQWAALIQDAKTRDRINAGIAKAEKQN